MKEEGNTSHVYQAYNKIVAKSNKISQSYSVGVQQECKYYNRGVVDQWGLIHSGLMVVRKVNKSTWTNLLAAFNIEPCTQVDFQTWCKKIQQCLLAGGSFKSKTSMDKYLLLPSWWQELKNDKKSIVGSVDKHCGWTVIFLYDLKRHHKLMMKDKQNMRICVECCKEKPSFLEKSGKKNKVGEEINNDDIEIFNNAKQNQEKVNDGLLSFQIKPVGLQKEELFQHMIKYCKMHRTLDQKVARGFLNFHSD